MFVEAFFLLYIYYSMMPYHKRYMDICNAGETLEWRLIMKGFDKYQKSYFMPPEESYDWVKKDSIDKAPVWFLSQ